MKSALKIAACVALLWAVPALAAPTAQQKCEAAKLKARGKYTLCMAKEKAKALRERTPDYEKCSTRLAVALWWAGTRWEIACHYLDNGDGTVTDLQTGLMWEQKTNLDSVPNAGDPHDADNSYNWSSSGTAPDGAAFTDFLGKLNNCQSVNTINITGGFAGHCDWRLPSIAELQAILLSPAPCGTSPCIDPVFGPTKADIHWASTTAANVPSAAYFVTFDGGYLYGATKTGAFYVRAVRGGSWLSTGTVPAGTTAKQSCEAAKVKAAGKYTLCIAKERAKAQLGSTPDYAKCPTKFSTALAKADTRAAAAGTACRYADNGDGTVSDLNTGLVWEQKTTTVGSGQNYADPHDVDNSYAWTSSGAAPDGSAFTDFLGESNDCESEDGSTVTGGFAGHCDWRLPSSAELPTIRVSPYPCGTHPCIDPVFGPTSQSLYWSATTFLGAAWTVDFSYGLVYLRSEIDNFYVRAVRGGL